jgi:outer membrane receptor protein involved in Fe transport
MKKTAFFLAGTALILGSAAAANGRSVAAGPGDTNSVQQLKDVVVTGVTREASKLASSVSVTTLKPAGINQSAPRTTAEIFRTIPGIRSESSGGEGNTNIAVRGVPISSGGSKYLQLQEDGLPVFLYGDMSFATSDIFLRFDQSVGRIEAIRGGSASTTASNSPAGIINFISKNGYEKSGSVATTVGMNYDTYRTDFDFGAPLGNGVSFHVGGFFRTGEGPRAVGYNANNGGQVKANVTKRFDNGYARLYLKHLNDRTVAYMPQPMRVIGTDANPVFEGVGSLSPNLSTPHSVYLSTNFGIGANGEPRSVNVSDGMHPVSNAIGSEFVFDLESGWRVESRSRLSRNSGRFVSPFTANVGSPTEMLASIGTSLGRDLTGAELNYSIKGDSAFTGDVAQVIHMFDTELKNFDNLVSDNSISKKFGNANVKLGYFRALQNVNMAWLWNSYLTEVKGGGTASPLDIATADGTSISQDGLFAYGVPGWGNCCQVEYNSQYTVSAPYAAFGLEATDNLSFDASVRLDNGRVRGVGHGTSVGEVDVNNNGTIEEVEKAVAVVDHASKNPVNYNYQYLSYSVGANYLLSENQSLYVRNSLGGSAKADRAIFPSGQYLFMGNPKDMIMQTEAGWKGQFENAVLFVTGFMANTTEEGGYEATTQRVIENDYAAYGAEIEGAYSKGKFDLRGALTYTKASITTEGATQGNTPRRQPALMYSVVPTYSFGKHLAGLSIIGQSKSYAQDANILVMPGYGIVNAFVNFNLAPGLNFSLNGNNLLNAVGITEAEEGAIPANGYVRARSITGRSISGTLRYTF